MVTKQSKTNIQDLFLYPYFIPTLIHSSFREFKANSANLSLK